MRGLSSVILELGLTDERGWQPWTAVREHLADPRTLVLSHLLFAARGP